MTKMSEISQLYKKVQNKDLNEGVDDVVVPFIRGVGKGARSLDDLIKGAKSGEKITDDMLKGLSKNDLESFKYETRDLTPPAPVAAEPPKFQGGADKVTDIKPAKEPAGGDSMVRRREAISLDDAQAQLKAGDRPQDVSTRLRNTVRTTMNPSARKAEIESMSKLDKFKDVAKKVVPPLAVAGTTAALLSRDTTDRDRQDAAADTKPAPEPETQAKVKIASGDTLSALAKKNKVSVADIAKANPELKDIHKINVGQELVMPKTTGNEIYQYGVGTESGPKSSKDIIALTKKKEGVNESLLSSFNDIVKSKSDNLFAEAKKKEKKADKDYDQDGKIESAKDEVWGSRFKAAKESGKLKEENLDEKYLRPIKKSENSIDATPVVDTISDFTRGVWTGAGGSLAKAALDYSVKNLGSKVGLGQGTTWEKESGQEEEKDTAARKRSPLAYRTGEVGGTIAGVTSLPTLGVRGAIKGVQLGAKYGPKLVGAAVRETPVLDKTLKGAKVVQDVTDKMTYPAAAGAMGAHLATAEKGEFRGQGPVLTNTRALIDKTYGQIPKLFQKKETVTESAKGSVPKTEKEKSLAALAEPKDKITHKDVLVGRGVVKENENSLFSEKELAFLEAMAIAPTPDEQAPSGGIKKKNEGSKSGTLSDEYIEFANQPGKKFYKNEKGEYAEPSSTNVAKEVNSMSKNQQTHEIEFADKPGQKFKALGPAPETHEIEFADKPGQKFTAMGPAPMGGPTPMSAATKPISTGSSAGGPTPMSAATTEPAPYGTGSDGKPYKSSIYPDNPLEDAEKALERVNKKLSSGALYKPTAKLSNASIKKVFEDHDVVIGKGTVTQIDPKTGKKVDYISPVTLNNPHMQGSKDEFKMPNPVPLPPKRPKELLDLKYKKMATDADIEAIKKDLVKEAKNQEDNEPVATGANKLHVNAKKAADYNTPNVKHKFENGEEVILTRGMAGDFLARHRQAKTADDKDAILKHANKSLDAFKSIAKGGKVPSEPKASAKPKISLGSMKGK